MGNRKNDESSKEEKEMAKSVEKIVKVDKIDNDLNKILSKGMKKYSETLKKLSKN